MSAARAVFLLGAAVGIAAVVIRLAAATQSVLHRGGLLRTNNFTDLNQADRGELEKLGLDPLAVDRIVEHRPYRNKLELVSRMIIPETLYGEIRHRIGVQPSHDPAEHPRVAWNGEIGGQAPSLASKAALLLRTPQFLFTPVFHLLHLSFRGPKRRGICSTLTPKEPQILDRDETSPW